MQPAEPEQAARLGGSSIWRCASGEGSDAAPYKRPVYTQTSSGVHDFPLPARSAPLKTTVTVSDGE